MRTFGDEDYMARTLLHGKDLETLRTSWESAAELEQWLEEFGEAVVEQLSVAVDRIEKDLTDQIPELTHVALEAD